MAIQVLIVHGQLPFAIKLKQTLERSAQFEAHPFTTVGAALDYLKDHIQDVAVIDFALPDYPGSQTVAQLRAVQPNLAVIATPRQDDEEMKALDVLAYVDTGFSARDLINLINSYFSRHERPTYNPPGTTALLARLNTKQSMPSPPRPSGDLPEYSSLDNVLNSAGGTNVFEQPSALGETPPSSDLAWTDEQPKQDSAFDDVLNSLPPEAKGNQPPRNPFTELVNSMRSEEEHKPLPSRQQQFVEYILSGGMDPLLEQIEQEQSEEGDTPTTPPKSVSERLAQEEPPLPQFEENGTVSDLVTGVQDKSFRNVLSILRGEEISEESDALIAPPTTADFEVGERSGAKPTLKSDDPFGFGGDDPTPARMILQRTLEKSASGDFSLEELLASIDAQLPQHRPKVQPLPSWLIEQQKRYQDDAYLVHEPDFLPEQLPDEPTPVEPSEDMYGGQTTRPARGQQIVTHPEALETEWLTGPKSASKVVPETLPEEIPSEGTLPHQGTLLHEVPVAEDDTPIHALVHLAEANENEVTQETPVAQQMSALEPQDEVVAPDAEEVAEAQEQEFFIEGFSVLPGMAGEYEESEEITSSRRLAALQERPAPPDIPLPEEASQVEEVDDGWFDQPEEAPLAAEEVSDSWDDQSEKASLAEERPAPPDIPLPEEAPAAEEVSEAWYDQSIESLVEEEEGVDWYNLPEEDFNTQFELMASFEVHNESGVASGALYTEVDVEPAAVEEAPVTVMETVPPPIEDPYLAQLALSLTEVSLELTAEATLLARNQQIVAYAGRMPAEEIEELRGTIADDWDAAPGEARIRFITAQGAGKDYMLYSRRTEDDLTLSLIFAGTTPLRDIRRQGKRLVDALLAVPEASPSVVSEAPSAPVKVEPVETTPYACVWVLRDPKAHLDPAASQAIVAGLNIQMREKQWGIQALHVHEDYVYMLADVPGEDPAYQIVRELKRRSAEIAHAQNPAYLADGLWADSYLVVTPGRELDVEEIQTFINFERME